MGKELEDILKQEIFNLKRRITELEAENTALKADTARESCVMSVCFPGLFFGAGVGFIFHLHSGIPL